MKPSQQIEVTLPDSCSASEAQLLIDLHTVAQLEESVENFANDLVKTWIASGDAVLKVLP